MIRIDNFLIETEIIDYRVGIIKVSESGKEYNKLLGYYKDVKSCINAIRNFVIHEKISEVDIDGLEGTVKAIENINKEFELKLLRVVAALNADTGN